MSVSVIITTYNKTQHVRNIILSLNNQSFQPDELILADDGSSEDIKNNVKDLIPACKFKVKFVTQEDKGFRAGKNRNNGAKEASGDFLVFFDQDLIFTKNYLEQIVATQKKNFFYTGFPIWLTESQSKAIDTDTITNCRFDSIVSTDQKKYIIKQYQKEYLYTLLHKYKLRKTGPSLRSCATAFYKNDFIKVNGFDESFQGWGYEDDDLGVRFHAAGIKGFNPIKTEYSLHCYHTQAQRAENGKSVNRDKFKKRARQLNRRNYRCEYGYDNPLGDDTVIVTDLN